MLALPPPAPAGLPGSGGQCLPAARAALPPGIKCRAGRDIGWSNACSCAASSRSPAATFRPPALLPGRRFCGQRCRTLPSRRTGELETELSSASLSLALQLEVAVLGSRA